MNKQNSLIYDMLRTPQQVQEDELAEIRKRAQAQQAQMLQRLSGNPIIDSLQQGFAQARARQAEVLPKQNQGYAAALGQVATGFGNEALGQRLQEAGLTPEAREQAEVRRLISSDDLTTPEGLETAAAKLESKRPDVAMRMREKAAQMRAAQQSAQQDAIMNQLKARQIQASTDLDRARAEEIRNKPVEGITADRKAIKSQMVEYLGTKQGVEFVKNIVKQEGDDSFLGRVSDEEIENRVPFLATLATDILANAKEAGQDMDFSQAVSKATKVYVSGTGLGKSALITEAESRDPFAGVNTKEDAKEAEQPIESETVTPVKEIKDPKKKAVRSKQVKETEKEIVRLKRLIAKAEQGLARSKSEKQVNYYTKQLNKYKPDLEDKEKFLDTLNTGG